MKVEIDQEWKEKLQVEFDKPYFSDLMSFVASEYMSHDIFPPFNEIFKAFSLSSFAKTSVVIIGQDPYHGEGQANGLCFSVADGVKIPPSLRNIFKEIENDIGNEKPKNGNLSRWAKQGVLLLNATLTVQAQQAGSHQNKGWEEFTDAVIQMLSNEKDNLVFMLWGAYAHKKGSIIDIKKHLILESAHPSPFAAYRGFFGNKHFSKANHFLAEKGLNIIEW